LYERVSDENSFSNIGIDYAGPVYVTNIYQSDGTTYKAWIVIVTCASSRAVYLDLVPDCSGPTCINVLKRYTSVIGAPKVVISDNGKNFISSDVQNFMSSKGVIWKFNVESAPWTGGFFERIVKMVKRSLRKILRTSKLSFDELVTVLKEIQNVLNNRPLTYMYTENLNETLTPNKLLYGRNIYTEISNADSEESNEPTEQLKRIRKLTDHFWKLWRDEYLLELREHDKLVRRKGRQHPTKGDIVLVKDDKLKRSRWRIGRVNELITSRDGNVRAAEVCVRANEQLHKLKRPINKLYPVEYTEQPTTDDDNVKLKFVSDSDVITFFVTSRLGECDIFL